MNRENLVKALRKEDFYVDLQGRMVIENVEILKAISGAAAIDNTGPFWNGNCSNSRCG